MFQLLEQIVEKPLNELDEYMKLMPSIDFYWLL